MKETFDIEDLKCCGNCHYEKDGVKVKKCLVLGVRYSSVCDHWEYAKMSFKMRQEEPETEQEV